MDLSATLGPRPISVKITPPCAAEAQDGSGTSEVAVEIRPARRPAVFHFEPNSLTSAEVPYADDTAVDVGRSVTAATTPSKNAPGVTSAATTATGDGFRFGLETNALVGEYSAPDDGALKALDASPRGGADRPAQRERSPPLSGVASADRLDDPQWLSSAMNTVVFMADPCTYNVARRTSAVLGAIRAIQKNSPLSGPANWIRSYSVANDFMFFPPYPSYDLGATTDKAREAVMEKYYHVHSPGNLASHSARPRVVVQACQQPNEDPAEVEGTAGSIAAVASSQAAPRSASGSAACHRSEQRITSAGPVLPNEPVTSVASVGVDAPDGGCELDSFAPSLGHENRKATADCFPQSTVPYDDGEDESDARSPADREPANSRSFVGLMLPSSVPPATEVVYIPWTHDVRCFSVSAIRQVLAEMPREQYGEAGDESAGAMGSYPFAGGSLVPAVTQIGTSRGDAWERASFEALHRLHGDARVAFVGAEGDRLAFASTAHCHGHPGSTSSSSGSSGNPYGEGDVRPAHEHTVRVGAPLFWCWGGCPIPCAIARPTKRASTHIALYFHTNGEDVGPPLQQKLRQIANTLHATVLAPEFPGYGCFAGEPSEAAVKGTVERLIQYVLTVNPHLTPSRIVLIGRSIGTHFALHAAEVITALFQSISQQARWCECPLPTTAKLPRHRPRGTSPLAGDHERITARSGLQCHHCFLGGIILISPFASVHAITDSVKRHVAGLHAMELELRRQDIRDNVVVPAPASWAAKTPPSQMAALARNWRAPKIPPLYRIAKWFVAERMDSAGVARQLQDAYGLFNKTPILLIHGLADTVIPWSHSIAIASTIRQAGSHEEGGSARVFLALLRKAGHEDFNGINEMRRFYREQVLRPLLQRAKAEVTKWSRIPNAKLVDGMDSTMQSKQPSTYGLTQSFSLSTGPVGGTAPGGHGPQPAHPARVDLATHRPQAAALACLRTENDVALGSAGPSSPGARGSDHVNGPACWLKSVGVQVAPATVEDASSPAPALSPEVLNTSNLTAYASSPRLGSFRAKGVSFTSTCFSTVGADTQSAPCDIGLVTRHAVAANALPVSKATALYRAHQRWVLLWRCVVIALIAAGGAHALAVGVTHGVLTTHSKLYSVCLRGIGTTPPDMLQRIDSGAFSHDPRVIIWSVFEALGLWGVALVSYFVPKYGIGVLSRLPPTAGGAPHWYYIIRILAYLAILIFGVLFGLIVALTPSGRGGVDWDSWGQETSLAPVCRAWIARVPRWTMVSFAAGHLAHAVFFVIRCH